MTNYETVSFSRRAMLFESNQMMKNLQVFEFYGTSIKDSELLEYDTALFSMWSLPGNALSLSEDLNH